MTCIPPVEGSTHSDLGISAWSWIHKEGFANLTYRSLLHNQKDLLVSPEQVRMIDNQSVDYARRRIRNDAAVSLAQVDVRALLTNPPSVLPPIETVLQQSATAQIHARVECVNAI